MSPPASRREALRRAALAGGALLAPALLRPSIARAQDDEAETEDFLVRAITVEQVAVLAYVTAAGSKRVDAKLKRSFERFRSQEQVHANALRNALDSIGVDPPDPPSDPADTEALDDLDDLDGGQELREQLAEIMRKLDRAKDVDAFLDLLVEIEQSELALYIRETPNFESEDLLRTGAEIAGCQAQHVVVLNEARGSMPAESVPELPSPEQGTTG